jgi:hypothetical protein
LTIKNEKQSKNSGSRAMNNVPALMLLAAFFLLTGAA